MLLYILIVLRRRIQLSSSGSSLYHLLKLTRELLINGEGIISNLYRIKDPFDMEGKWWYFNECSHELLYLNIH